MATRAFASFAEASAFAKRVARERGAIVHVVRHDCEFVVEDAFVLEPPTPAAPVYEPLPSINRPTKIASWNRPTPRREQRPSVDRPTQRKRSKKSKNIPFVSELPEGARLCVECGVVISPDRVRAVPSVTRCIKCQSQFEGTHDTRPRINEGLAGTREGHKKMRGQLWGDMRNRGRGR